MGSDEVKYGPKTNFYASNVFSGTSQMSTVVQCRTSPLTAVTVMAAAYTNPSCFYRVERTTFSGFRLSSPYYAVGFTAEL